MTKKWKTTLIESDLHQAIKQYCVENKLPLIQTINEWLTERILKEAGGTP